MINATYQQPYPAVLSTLWNYVAIFYFPNLPKSFTQLPQVQYLLCSQQSLYNINTSLLLRPVCANHENTLPKLNQAEASQAMLNCF